MTSSNQPINDFHDASPLPGRYVRLPDGVDVWTVEKGTGEPVLLVHGIPTSSYLWRNVQRKLATHYRTLAPDLIGLGKTDIPDGYSPDMITQARTLASLLDTLGESSAHVVAHDIGGGVATMFCELFPRRAKSLTFSNSGLLKYYWPIPAVKAMRIPVAGEMILKMLTRRSFRVISRRGVYATDKMSPQVADHYYRYFSDYDGRRKLLRVVRTFDAERIEVGLRNIVKSKIPTNLLWGKDDPFQVINEARELRDVLDLQHYVEVDEAGHFWQEEKPAEMAEALHYLIGETKVAASPFEVGVA